MSKYSCCCPSPFPPPQQPVETQPIQDKLVINVTSAAPSFPTTPAPATTNLSSHSVYSSCSSSSSCISTKDKPFSNDFILSCIKEHPPLIQFGPIKFLARTREISAPIGGSRSLEDESVVSIKRQIEMLGQFLAALALEKSGKQGV